MKRIRFVMRNLKIGGAEKILLTILKNIDVSKYECELVLYSKEGQLIQEIPKNITCKFLVPKNDKKFKNKVKRSIFFNLLKYFPFMVKLYLNKKFSKSDITIAFMEGISTNVGHLFNGPKIAIVHTDVVKNPWADKFFISVRNQEKIYKKYDKIINLSQGSLESFRNKFPHLDKKKEIIIHNPIDEKEINYFSQITSENFFKWCLLTKNTIKLVTVGRLDPVKNLGFLIESFYHLENSHNSEKFSLTIIGSGNIEEEKKLKEKIENLKIKNVYFLGYIRNPLPYVRKSNLFISTSLVESYPTSIIESLVVGTPVIAMENAGSIEVLKNVENSELIKSGISSLNFSKHIFEFLKEEKKMSNQNNIFNLDTTLNEYYKLIDGVCYDKKRKN